MLNKEENQKAEKKKDRSLAYAICMGGAFVAGFCGYTGLTIILFIASLVVVFLSMDIKDDSERYIRPQKSTKKSYYKSDYEEYRHYKHCKKHTR